MEIEKLVYGGDGLARAPADAHGKGKTLFVPFVIPGEQVEATIVEDRPGFARAKLDQVVRASPSRIFPECPYFGRCGGCQYQHIEYEAQLRYKADILRETLRRTAKLDLQQEIEIHASGPWSYRNRTRLQLRHKPEFALGYFRHNSHDVLPVEMCPISSSIINIAIAAVWKLGRSGEVPESVRGLQFFTNHDDTQLLVEAYSVRAEASGSASRRETPAVFENFAAALRHELPEVRGVAFFPVSSLDDEKQQRAPSTTLREEEPPNIGDVALQYEVEQCSYRVSAGSFFQTNRFLLEKLIQVATAAKKGRLALDLYAGAGLFTQVLARNFDQVLAVEVSPHSLSDLRSNVPGNVKCMKTTTEAFLAERARHISPEFILLDPPRAGLGEKTAATLGRMSASRVTYVSCDPATLARDLRVLLESGFRVEQAHLIDMFPQTFHMESVLHLTR